jgi:hypothetical protein
MSSTFAIYAQPPTAPLETAASSIGYPTVRAALEALRTKPGVKFRTENGWLIAQDDEGFAAYMFVPMGHPAYPTVIKRSVFNRDGKAYIGTNALCEASKTVCDTFLGQL